MTIRAIRRTVVTRTIERALLGLARLFTTHGAHHLGGGCAKARNLKAEHDRQHPQQHHEPGTPNEDLLTLVATTHAAELRPHD